MCTLHICQYRDFEIQKYCAHGYYNFSGTFYGYDNQRNNEDLCNILCDRRRSRHPVYHIFWLSFLNPLDIHVLLLPLLFHYDGP